MSSAIWITGPPASGRSVLARAAAAELRAAGEPVVVLELDEIRAIVTPSPTCTDTEREVVYRALVYMAAAFAAAEMPVLIDATAHRRAWRDLARRLIARFAEVQVVCPMDGCREREPRRGAWHARRGIDEPAGLRGSVAPGAEVPYEPALRPELTIDPATEDRETAVRRIADLVRRLRGPVARATGDGAASWAIWVTGLPGSGKTTLSRRAAETLAAAGAPVRVLEFSEFRRMVLGDLPESDATRDIVHRALAYTAKLLAESGVRVIVDATAPRRAWRRLARELITHFAEVQLVCPSDVCGDRERAARWHLGLPQSCRPSEHPAPAPDLALAYEGSLDAELTLHTDPGGLAGNVEALLRLAQRLQHATASRGSAQQRSLAH